MVDFLCSAILGFTRDCDEVVAKAAGNYLLLRSILSLEDSHSYPPGGRVKPGDYFWPLQIAHIYLLYLFTCIYFWLCQGKTGRDVARDDLKLLLQLLPPPKC